MSAYSPGEYWEQRLSADVSLATVGHKSLGRVYNGWLYRARYKAMARALARLRIDPRGMSVCDIGVGSGAWLPYWEQRGAADITGMDITDASVSSLRMAYPHYEFSRGDITSDGVSLSANSFDLVTALDVLFHITDDSAFARAIANLARSLRPGGLAIITDQFPDVSGPRARTEHSRSLEGYEKQLARNNLSTIAIQPIFTWMVGSRSPRLPLRLVRRLARTPVEWVNGLIAFPLYLADRIAMKRCDRGPSLNILVAQKDGPGDGR